jgi:hypothetical protein
MAEDVKTPEVPVESPKVEAVPAVDPVVVHKKSISDALSSAGHVTKDVADKVGHSVVEAILALRGK